MPVEQPLNAIDAELERLLAIEPSPDFAARVRQRVSQEQVTGSSWSAGPLLVAAVGLVAIVAGALSLPTQRSLDREAPVVALSPADIEVPLPRDAAPPSTPARAMRVERGTVRVRALKSSGPEVVFDPRQGVAIARMVELAGRGTVVDIPEGRDQMPLAVTPLTIFPIQVEPPTPTNALERSSL